ncbi:MFS transporter [Pseudokineococcus sp. 1T1Z-3]|uniref:MFS transporter n=1 Tax=Pseudokineococcus sp. 1T1Z-3 TaxID=3132745 RepID=UPI0030A3BA90
MTSSTTPRRPLAPRSPGRRAESGGTVDRRPPSSELGSVAGAAAAPPAAAAAHRPTRWRSVIDSFREYRHLPEVAGRSYLPVTFLARLPVTMVPVAILTLGQVATGSSAVAGAAAAAAAVGEAVGAPATGALADRLGQRRVLLAVAGLHALALVTLLVAASSGLPLGLVLAAAAVGATVPQVGPLSRVRWMAMSPRHTRTAFAFEGTADEVGFALGPALVGLSAWALGASAPVVLAALLVVGAVSAFALHPSAQAVPVRTAAERAADREAVRERRRADGGRRREPLALVPLVGMLAVGSFFGGSNTALTASAAAAGVAEAAGLVVAAMAVGSAVTALAVVALPASLGPWRRWAGAAAVLVVGALLMLWAAPGLPLLVVTTVLAGLAIGPLLVTIFDVAGRLAPEGGAGLALTLLTSGVVLGVATGSGVAGVLAERVSPTAGFGVGVVAALVLLALVLVAAATRRPLPPPAG